MAAAHGTPPVRKREIFGWAMYDFANSSYTTVVISVIYSSFFVDYIVPAGSDARDTYWSVAIIASTVLALLLSPFVGAICDYGGGKKKWLALTTVACAGATLGLFFVQPGDLWLAVALITVSNAAFMIGESFCGSFLTDLATKETMGKISGLGWGLGYFGGLLCMVAMLVLITAEPESDLTLFVQQNQQAMVFIGVFFAIAALPTFILVAERSTPAPGFEGASFGKLMRTGLAEMADSAKLARKYPVLLKFFLAFTVYLAGLEVVMKFVGIYARSEVKLSVADLSVMFIIIQLSAALGALLFGLLEGRIGPKRTVMATLFWWMGGILGIYFLFDIADLTGFEPRQVFFGVSLVAGAGIGSLQSSSRAVVGLLSPAARSAQMFGFWGTFSRFGLILGMSFGPVSDMVGRQNAMLLVLAFFVVGAVMLAGVPIDEGIRAAAEADRLDRGEALAKTGPV